MSNDVAWDYLSVDLTSVIIIKYKMWVLSDFRTSFKCY